MSTELTTAEMRARLDRCGIHADDTSYEEVGEWLCENDWVLELALEAIARRERVECFQSNLKRIKIPKDGKPRYDDVCACGHWRALHRKQCIDRSCSCQAFTDRAAELEG